MNIIYESIIRCFLKQPLEHSRVLVFSGQLRQRVLSRNHKVIKLSVLYENEEEKKPDSTCWTVCCAVHYHYQNKLTDHNDCIEHLWKSRTKE